MRGSDDEFACGLITYYKEETISQSQITEKIISLNDVQNDVMVPAYHRSHSEPEESRQLSDMIEGAWVDRSLITSTLCSINLTLIIVLLNAEGIGQEIM